ncbi:unnamed protein product [Closterium sp. NIES-64]|nr:unnamed protein product [Closterium sp. NIES-64]
MTIPRSVEVKAAQHKNSPPLPFRLPPSCFPRQEVEVVPLRKICRRPETEYRVRAAQQVAKAVGGGEGKKASVKQSKGN